MIKKRIAARFDLSFDGLSSPLEKIAEILEERMDKWDEKLAGVLVSFDQPKLLSKVGKIIDEYAVIRVTAKYTGTYFCPKPGEKYKAVVKQVTEEHIGLLILSYNAVILSSNPGKLKFEQGWKLDGVPLKEEDEIQVEVER